MTGETQCLNVPSFLHDSMHHDEILTLHNFDSVFLIYVGDLPPQRLAFVFLLLTWVLALTME